MGAHDTRLRRTNVDGRAQLVASDTSPHGKS
jgi:hypothetical protein